MSIGGEIGVRSVLLRILACHLNEPFELKTFIPKLLCAQCYAYEFRYAIITVSSSLKQSLQKSSKSLVLLLSKWEVGLQARRFEIYIVAETINLFPL